MCILLNSQIRFNISSFDDPFGAVAKLFTSDGQICTHYRRLFWILPFHHVTFMYFKLLYNTTCLYMTIILVFFLNLYNTCIFIKLICFLSFFFIVGKTNNTVRSPPVNLARLNQSPKGDSKAVDELNHQVIFKQIIW